jgi:hypothetical protein
VLQICAALGTLATVTQPRDRKIGQLGAELITKLIVEDRRRLCHAVESTEAWMPEGKEARKELRAFVAELRRIARDSETEHLVKGVELFWGDLRRELPNLDASGSIN